MSIELPTRQRILRCRTGSVRHARRRRRLAGRDRRRGRRAQADRPLLVPVEGRARRCRAGDGGGRAGGRDRRGRACMRRRSARRVDAVVRAVFRPAVRRPALLGLVREMSRLPGGAGRPAAGAAAAVDRPLRRLRLAGDGQGSAAPGRPEVRWPALAYATVTGLATEPEALRAVGWQPTAIGLRTLHDELRAFLRASLTP